MKALELISNFDYTPEFNGNREEKTPMVLTIHLLGGSENMECMSGGKRDEVLFMEKAIVKITNPIKIRVDGGALKDITPADIATLGGLRELWSEFWGAYAEKTEIDRKNS